MTESQPEAPATATAPAQPAEQQPAQQRPASQTTPPPAPDASTPVSGEQPDDRGAILGPGAKGDPANPAAPAEPEVDENLVKAAVARAEAEEAEREKARSDDEKGA